MTTYESLKRRIQTQLWRDDEGNEHTGDELFARMVRLGRLTDWRELDAYKIGDVFRTGVSAYERVA